MNYEIKLHCRVCDVQIAREVGTMRDYIKIQSKPAFQLLKCPKRCRDSDGKEYVTEIRVCEVDV